MVSWASVPSNTGVAMSTAGPHHSCKHSPTMHHARTGSDSTGRISSHKPRIRRRNRLIMSCLECRRRKLKCDKSVPCGNCTRLHVDCLYISVADDDAQQRLANYKERVGALERDLELEATTQLPASAATEARTNSPRRVSSDLCHHNAEGHSDSSFSEEDDLLEPTPLASIDNVYEANDDDELMDLGVQMGKMRITERIGGWTRPKFVEELKDTLADVKSNRAATQQSPSLLDHDNQRPRDPRQYLASRSYIGPGPDYIAPSSKFIFSGSGNAESLMDHLPSRATADVLIMQYWHAVHYMCKVVHRQSFEAQYAVFWDTINSGIEPVAPVQAIIFAAMFSASVSMTEQDALSLFNEPRASLINRLRIGTEVALTKANVLRTTKIDTMQAFVMFLIPFVRTEVSRAHSSLVGAAIRLAECMGLHRDGTLYGMGAIEIQVRRMIWHQLCFLDMRTCEATGPRPQIRREDYDTKLPWNVDDRDLLGPHPVMRDKPGWTDTTCMRIRAECMDMRRRVYFEIQLIDKKRATLTALLIKIQKFRNHIEGKYFPMMDPSIPLHNLSRIIAQCYMSGYHLQSLHRYMFNTSQVMPDRLRQVLIAAGLNEMEKGMVLENTPELKQWTWYKGAIYQYHCSILLLIEVYSYPMRKDAARIWRCLDYIFELPAHLSPKEKAEFVFSDLATRMTIYQDMRKTKATSQLERQVSGSNKSSFRPPPPASAIVDASGQMFQKQAASPSRIGPPSGSPEPDNWSNGSNSGQPSSSNVVDPVMGEIDWDEFAKFYTETGELNLSDYNMDQFNGNPTTGMLQQAVSTDPALVPFNGLPSSQGVQFISNMHPITQDLKDVDFSALPTYVPRPPDRPAYYYHNL